MGKCGRAHNSTQGAQMAGDLGQSLGRSTPASPWMHGANEKTGAASRDSPCCLYHVSHDHL